MARCMSPSMRKCLIHAMRRFACKYVTYSLFSTCKRPVIPTDQRIVQSLFCDKYAHLYFLWDTYGFCWGLWLLPFAAFCKPQLFHIDLNPTVLSWSNNHNLSNEQNTILLHSLTKWPSKKNNPLAKSSNFFVLASFSRAPINFLSVLLTPN